MIGTERRIVLEHEAFNALVRGGELTVHMEDGSTVKMILRDIGFNKMQNCIDSAKAGFFHYKGATAKCDGTVIDS